MHHRTALRITAATWVALLVCADDTDNKATTNAGAAAAAAAATCPTEALPTKTETIEQTSTIQADGRKRVVVARFTPDDDTVKAGQFNFVLSDGTVRESSVFNNITGTAIEGLSTGLDRAAGEFVMLFDDEAAVRRYIERINQFYRTTGWTLRIDIQRDVPVANKPNCSQREETQWLSTTASLPTEEASALYTNANTDLLLRYEGKVASGDAPALALHGVRDETGLPVDINRLTFDDVDAEEGLDAGRAIFTESQGTIIGFESGVTVLHRADFDGRLASVVVRRADGGGIAHANLAAPTSEAAEPDDGDFEEPSLPGNRLPNEPYPVTVAVRECRAPANYLWAEASYGTDTPRSTSFAVPDFEDFDAFDRRVAAVPLTARSGPEKAAQCTAVTSALPKACTPYAAADVTRLRAGCDALGSDDAKAACEASVKVMDNHCGFVADTAADTEAFCSAAEEAQDVAPDGEVTTRAWVLSGQFAQIRTDAMTTPRNGASVTHTATLPAGSALWAETDDARPNAENDYFLSVLPSCQTGSGVVTAMLERNGETITESCEVQDGNPVEPFTFNTCTITIPGGAAERTDVITLTSGAAETTLRVEF